MTAILTQPQEIAIGTNGVSHWLTVDGEVITISRKQYFDILSVDDTEIDSMLAIMTGHIVPDIDEVNTELMDPDYADWLDSVSSGISFS